jgi:hypothetical protein
MKIRAWNGCIRNELPQPVAGWAAIYFRTLPYHETVPHRASHLRHDGVRLCPRAAQLGGNSTRRKTNDRIAGRRISCARRFDAASQSAQGYFARSGKCIERTGHTRMAGAGRDGNDARAGKIAMADGLLVTSTTETSYYNSRLCIRIVPRVAIGRRIHSAHEQFPALERLLISPRCIGDR